MYRKTAIQGLSCRVSDLFFGVRDPVTVDELVKASEGQNSPIWCCALFRSTRYSFEGGGTRHKFNLELPQVKSMERHAPQNRSQRQVSDCRMVFSPKGRRSGFGVPRRKSGENNGSIVPVLFFSGVKQVEIQTGCSCAFACADGAWRAAGGRKLACRKKSRADRSMGTCSAKSYGLIRVVLHSRLLAAGMFLQLTTSGMISP